MIREVNGNKPKIHKTAFIADTAEIIGEVSIGERCSIWYNAVLRGDNSPVKIGKETNIQENCSFHGGKNHPTTVGNHVTVGHNAVVHGCTIEDECMIGMGAIILNGAKVGKESLIAAGAVVKENAIIPTRSLVAGVPGKIVRKLTDKDIKRIKENTDEYLELMKLYL